MEPDERYVEAAHKETDGEQPEAFVRNASSSAFLVPSASAAPGFGPAARCSRKPKASGNITIDIIPTTNIVVCQSSRRYCRSDTNGTIAYWPKDPPAVVTPSATERFSI